MTPPRPSRRPEAGAADLCLAGGQVADVRAGVLVRAAVAISGERISAVGPEAVLTTGARRVVDVSGRVIAPGYIEPHTHAVLANPVEFAGALLRCGTTTALVDALPLQVLVPPDRLPALLERLAALPLALRWQIRLHPPAFPEEERFALEWLRDLWRLPSVAAVGEVTRWTDLYDGVPELAAKVAAARADGRRVEGHAPGASYERLAVLAARGFSSCHEAVTAQEVLDRLQAGLHVMLRHSPIRPDLPRLAPAVTSDLWTSERLMLTADGPTPAYIEDRGYMDHVLRTAIRNGIPPLVALRMATLNPAAYYGLADRGEVKPGARADLNVLPDATEPRPEVVIAGGQIVAERGALLRPLPAFDWADTLGPLRLPRVSRDVFAPDASLPACRLVNDVITEPTEMASADGWLQTALVDRKGRWVTRCRLEGFAARLGGLATTVNTALDLLVVGQEPADMAAAARRLADLGGGIVVVEEGREVFAFPLELGGIFSCRPWAAVVEANRRLSALLRVRGYRFTDPIYSLMFLTFDSLPWVRLTSRGVWDVRSRRVMSPSLRL
ncbi:MAG: adenine deaminase C-terminal domain-containing protein [Armatimonadota bacterium]|nr:adenine deaminase C-terminal domain-containing protein [Armatimonadota bacterium]